ncbi:retrovirus-related pol polyprotein from transposon TNT 1-94, partial [Tanacetum coccineum]
SFLKNHEPTVSPLNDNQIDFRISFDESDDEDYTVIYDRNSFSYKIIYVNDLKTDSKNDNDEVNMPSFSSPEPTVSYFDDLDNFKDFVKEFPVIVYNDALMSKLDFLNEPTISPQHIDEFNLKESLSEYDEEEQNVLYFNDLFHFNVIYPNDSKSDKDNDNDKIDIKQSLGVIMEYLVKISKKARILELKRRHLKITVLTTIRRIYQGRYGISVPALHKRPRRKQESIRRIQGRPIRHIQAMEIKYSGRYQTCEETLELAEESRLKMLAKQNDPSLKEKKVNIAPVDYVALNILSEHFVKHFVPQKQLSAEQAYWLPISKPVSKNPPVPSEPVLKKEIPRELPSISLAFEKDVKPFAQTLKEYFRMFELGLNKELKEMKSVFTQMEIEVAKCSVDKKYFEIEKKELSLDNDRLLEHIICQDVMNIVMHANDQTDNVLPANNNSLEHDNSALDLLKHENDRLMELLISQDLSFMDEYNETLVIKAELAKKNDMIKKAVYNELSKRYAPEFKEFYIINELQAQLKAKNVSIEKLKEHIANTKGKNVIEIVQNVNNLNVVTLKVYKLDLPPLFPCIKNNMAVHVDYLKHTQENVDILHEIVKHARDLRPLDSDLASACKFVTRIQELIVYVIATCPSSKHVSNKLVAVTPMNRTRKVRRVSSSTEASRSKPRSNTKKDRISQTSFCNKNVKHSMLNANSKLVCATCHECMFDAIHDLCVSGYLNDVNARVKSNWKPTGRTFTIVENTCPLTRNISTNVVPPRKSISATPAKQTQPNLEVAFRKHTCYVQNLDGDDLLSGSRDTNLYTISLDDMLKSSPICLLSKASKTKSWLWHQRLSHLNFGTLNQLAKEGLVRGLPKLKFEKDHLCSARSLGKSKKSTHKPKADDTNQEKIYLLHMDLYGPIRVESINGKIYILVIVDD